MNKESFTKGFVKRAQEHGLTVKQANGLMEGLQNFGGQALDWAKQHPQGAGAIAGGVGGGVLGGMMGGGKGALLGAAGGAGAGYYGGDLYDKAHWSERQSPNIQGNELNSGPLDATAANPDLNSGNPPQTSPFNSANNPELFKGNQPMQMGIDLGPEGGNQNITPGYQPISNPQLIGGQRFGQY